MFLTRLVYASKVSEHFKPEDLEKILHSAQKHNSESNVTGILIYSHKYFLQVLEGGRENVNRLYHKILLDNRHKEPLIISYRKIDQRKFENWNMKMYLETAIHRSRILKFSGADVFNPYLLSDESAVCFLEDIIK